MIRQIRLDPYDLNKKRSMDMKDRVRDRMARAGNDTGELLELLVAIASAELASFYKTTLLCCNLLSHQEENLEKVAERALKENLKHFEVLATRIYELGGDLPEDIRTLRDRTPFPFGSLPRDTGDMKRILEFLISTERSVSEGYADLCRITEFGDRRTYDIANRILIEKMEHETWFLEILSGAGDARYGSEQARSVPERIISIEELQDRMWG